VTITQMVTMVILVAMAVYLIKVKKVPVV